MSTSTPDTTVNPAFAELEVTGIQTKFDQVSGFGISMNVVAQKTGTTETGAPQYSYRMAGIPEYPDIQASAPLDANDSSLFTWWSEILEGTITPKDATLTLYDPESSPQLVFNIVGALLSSYSIEAGSSDNAGQPPRISVTFDIQSWAKQ